MKLQVHLKGRLCQVSVMSFELGQTRRTELRRYMKTGSLCHARGGFGRCLVMGQIDPHE